MSLLPSGAPLPQQEGEPTFETSEFLVFEESSLAGTCSFHDLFASSSADLPALLALVILRGLGTRGLVSLRLLLLDEPHPGRRHVRRLGFIARAAETVLQVHSRDGRAERVAWRITQGDKDT